MKHRMSIANGKEVKKLTNCKPSQRKICKIVRMNQRRFSSTNSSRRDCISSRAHRRSASLGWLCGSAYALRRGSRSGISQQRRAKRCISASKIRSSVSTLPAGRAPAPRREERVAAVCGFLPRQRVCAARQKKPTLHRRAGNAGKRRLETQKSPAAAEKSSHSGGASIAFG